MRPGGGIGGGAKALQPEVGDDVMDLRFRHRAPTITGLQLGWKVRVHVQGIGVARDQVIGLHHLRAHPQPPAAGVEHDVRVERIERALTPSGMGVE
ncbi:MAG: hypothetical protein FD153_441 [Rhodospirillaceae bacterium]|nr:MAG: hypothetical protein FD153_441 [Rhodospirillaceae bacterium]